MRSITSSAFTGLFIPVLATIIVTFAVLDSFGGGVKSISSQLSPKDVVEKFCQIDANGLRLSSDTRGDIDQLLDWGEEGGYDEMIVIKDVIVNRVAITSSTATVSVVYRILGSTDSFNFSKAPNKKSIVNFKLAKNGGFWEIKEPVIAPHVNWKNAINHLRLLQEREPSRKKQLESIIKEIEKAVKQEANDK